MVVVICTSDTQLISSFLIPFKLTTIFVNFQGLASAKNQTTALTSYVLISLLETNLQIDETVLANAKACIISDVTNDKYTLAISSYALGLLNLPQEVQQRLNKLMGLAETENGLLWWKQSGTFFFL